MLDGGTWKCIDVSEFCWKAITTAEEYIFWNMSETVFNLGESWGNKATYCVIYVLLLREVSMQSIKDDLITRICRFHSGKSKKKGENSKTSIQGMYSPPSDLHTQDLLL